jgi:hypothetical protein
MADTQRVNFRSLTSSVGLSPPVLKPASNAIGVKSPDALYETLKANADSLTQLLETLRER